MALLVSQARLTLCVPAMSVHITIVCVLSVLSKALFCGALYSGVERVSEWCMTQ
jgi:hypothetical protein